MFEVNSMNHNKLKNTYLTIPFIICRVNPCDYHVQLGENTLIGQSSDIQIIQLDRIIRHKGYSDKRKAVFS